MHGIHISHNDVDASGVNMPEERKMIEACEARAPSDSLNASSARSPTKGPFG